ncbi:8473_t:CDS:2, partial [Racocetra fulgida]
VKIEGMETEGTEEVDDIFNGKHNYICSYVINETTHWYCDDKKEANDQLNIIFVNEHAAHFQQNKIIQITSQPATIPPLVMITNNNKDNLSTNESDDDRDDRDNNFTVANLPINKCK